MRSVTWGSGAAQLGVGALPVVSVLPAGEDHASWAAGGLMTAFAAGALAGSLGCAGRPFGQERPERVARTQIFTLGAGIKSTFAAAGAGWRER
ncbi:hypothetical protein [Streptomyces griseorubiginosus]|uniref:hypothetical protein n=1 Tax=Streptomyces griseorubiginosus TaxID=67304 RepID=UPI00364DCE54